jgi:membrane-associated PAP2 superfamily phosphatase
VRATRSPSFLDYYRSDDGLLFLQRQARRLAAMALALLAIFDVTDLDRAITRLFFDAGRGTFPLTNAWWLKIALHDAVRTVGGVAALALLAVAATAWLAPRLRAAHARRHELAFMACAAVLSAAAIVAMKHYSAHACPWDIAEFGGLVPYRELLGRHEALDPIQGCFPAAHPLVGYAWLCVGFALVPSAPHAARHLAWAALTAGTIAGAVQVVRGAHFVSHVLWTAWAVWFVNLVLLSVCRLCGTLALRRARKPNACSPAASRHRA